MTPRRIKIMIAACWLWAAFCALGPVIGWNENVFKKVFSSKFHSFHLNILNMKNIPYEEIIYACCHYLHQLCSVYTEYFKMKIEF